MCGVLFQFVKLVKVCKMKLYHFENCRKLGEMGLKRNCESAADKSKCAHTAHSGSVKPLTLIKRQGQ